jgi:heme-degrading monooxygenase HmoA
MVTVIETWFLKEEFTEKVIPVMQELDDLVGPGAHADPGWTGHAHFYQPDATPNQVIMIYPWRDREMHRQITATEDPMLADFTSKYCEQPRRLEYLTELEVEVDHDDH